MGESVRWATALGAMAALAACAAASGAGGEAIAQSTTSAASGPAATAGPPPVIPRTAAGALDLSQPWGVVTANRRIWCTMTDNEPVYWFWRGDVFSRRAGEPDKLLFKVEGLNTRTCANQFDPAKGGWFVRSTSREILLYLDPQSGQVLSTWTNPWTNAAVDVLHVANDPVNGEFTTRRRDGSPTRWTGATIGASWFQTTTIPLFYNNPLAGAYQDEVGGKYHATEMFNFMGDSADLVNLSVNSADSKVGWTRISDWLPWMRMGDREGMLYFHTAGRKLMNWDDVSPLMRDEVARNYPDYRNPPPINDPRPNETSWTYYLKVKTGDVVPPKR